MSKNTSGLLNEIKESLPFHSEGIPLLVSPALLRTRFLGQIDLARMRQDKAGWLIEIAEVKSSETGEKVMIRGQRKRLFASQNFLSGLFGARSKLISLIK